MGESLRAFVAVHLPEDVRALMAELQAALRRSGAGRAVRWVDPAGMHLTLKFLGNIDAEQVESVTAALRMASAGSGPFAVTTGALGVFPRMAAPRVLWLGVDGSLTLLGQLQAAVEDALAALGFAPEGRAFSPHLTLGRVREGTAPETLRALGQMVERAAPPERLPIPVTSVSLMRSVLRPGGAVYTSLANISLLRN